MKPELAHTIVKDKFLILFNVLGQDSCEFVSLIVWFSTDMVVSGVPNKTDRHACHVAMMSLEMVQASRDFQIPHLPGEPLKIRVGLHSGRIPVFLRIL